MNKIIINTPNLQTAKNQIKNTKKPIIVQAQSPEFNRKILEYGKFQVLLDIHSSSQNKDKPKYLDSALNHLLAKIAAKNSVSLGIDLAKLRKLDKRQKAITLARIKQNIKIARKAKVKITLLNIKDIKNASSFLQSIGASSQQTKQFLS